MPTRLPIMPNSLPNQFGVLSVPHCCHGDDGVPKPVRAGHHCSDASSMRGLRSQRRWLPPRANDARNTMTMQIMNTIMISGGIDAT